MTTSLKFYGNISVSAAAAEHGQKAREEFYASTLERDKRLESHTLRGAGITSRSSSGRRKRTATY